MISASFGFQIIDKAVTFVVQSIGYGYSGTTQL